MNAAPQPWHGAPARIVFEDAHLRVVFKPGGSDMLLLTFGNADNLAEGTRFTADRLVTAYGINCLGFMPRAANWYPAASMRAAAEAVAYTLAAFGIRMAYGSSLGAYAALKYAALLGATHVVAYCPQWSIDPAECGAQESGYWDLFRPEMAGMGIRPADLAGHITLFYDPHHPHDSYHQRQIAAAAAAAAADHTLTLTLCRTPHTGHHVALVLKGSALTAAILAACFAGQEGRLYAVTAPPRRASPIRRATLLAAAAARHPVLTARAIAQLAGQGQLAVLNGAPWLPALLATLRHSHPALASRTLEHLLAGLPAPRARLARDPPGPTPSPRLHTAHETVLCYSALGGCLVHLAPAALAAGIPGTVPVHLQGGLLCATVAGTPHACLAIDEHATELAPPGSHADCYAAIPAGEGRVHLQARAHYASAEPDGTVWSNATAPLGWEVFTLAPEPAG